jgi:hypothetical protein
MTCNTWDAAFFRSSASFSSLVSRATCASRLAIEGLRGRTVFGALRLLRAAIFRRCALGDSPPALERRRIAARRLRIRHLLLA